MPQEAADVCVMRVLGDNAQLGYPTLELLHNPWNHSKYICPSPFSRHTTPGAAMEELITIVLTYDSYGQSSDSEEDADEYGQHLMVSQCPLSYTECLHPWTELHLSYRDIRHSCSISRASCGTGCLTSLRLKICWAFALCGMGIRGSNLSIEPAFLLPL